MTYALETALTSEDPTSQIDALGSLLRLVDRPPSAEELRLARALLSSENELVRYEAVACLGLHWADPGSLPILLQRIGTEVDEDVVRVTVSALDRYAQVDRDRSTSILEALRATTGTVVMQWKQRLLTLAIRRIEGSLPLEAFYSELEAEP